MSEQEFAQIMLEGDKDDAYRLAYDGLITKEMVEQGEVRQELVADVLQGIADAEKARR